MTITRDIIEALPSVSLRGRVYVAKDALLAFVALDPSASSPSSGSGTGQAEPTKAEPDEPSGAVPRRLKVTAHAIPETDE